MKKNFTKSLLRVLALMVLIAVPSVGHAGVVSGDVNGDDKASIDDVVSLIDYLLSGDAGLIDVANADVDHDGSVSIDDVVGLIDNLLSHPQTPDPIEGDWVDLGLLSGTIWATRNVGASAPEDYGDYFAWGETEPKDYYYWITYKWCQWYVDDEYGYLHYTITKYYTGLDDYLDNKNELDPEDDAAYVHYPGGRMPTSTQMSELIGGCNWQWTQRNGVNGQLVTGPNGNTMFLPAVGCRWYESLEDAGLFGYYWTRTLYPGAPEGAFSFLFHSVNWCGWGCSYRSAGFAVRAVRVS